MRSSAIVGVCTALLLTVLMTAAGGAINPILTYQGFLRDMDGVAYPDGAYQFTFVIYPDSVGGTALWSESQTLNVADGLVHANLGSVVPLAQSVFASAPLWLGVQLESEPEFTPRHFIGSSVYAFVAADAEALGGHPAEYFADTASVQTSLQQAIAAHDSDAQAHRPLDLDASEIVSGVIDPARLPAVEIGSAEVTDGSLLAEDLADSVITGDKIAAGTIQSEHLSSSSFTGANIEDGSLTADDLADSTITGDKIATGSITSEHLAETAFTGADITDGSLTSADLADSSITGAKLATGSIEAVHLSGVAITGAQIADHTITGADIQLAGIGFNEIEPQVISDYHIANASISGYKLKANSVSGYEIEDLSLSGDDLADNSLVARHFANNQITAQKIVDEPGVKEANSPLLTSVNSSPVTWFGVSMNLPAAGYVIAIFTCYTSLSTGEIAQISLSQNQNTFDGRVVEARLSSGSGAIGGNLPMTVIQTFTFATGGPISIYGNVRASASSSGPVDFASGSIQAIYIPTTY